MVALTSCTESAIWVTHVPKVLRAARSASSSTCTQGCGPMGPILFKGFFESRVAFSAEKYESTHGGTECLSLGTPRLVIASLDSAGLGFDEIFASSASNTCNNDGCISAFPWFPASNNSVVLEGSVRSLQCITRDPAREHLRFLLTP